MTNDLFVTSPRPALPEPLRARWQPLRLGLVELFHYDSEEFWFHDGHLLLRGNNGTGKSKVLSLTLPLLLDAQLRSSRVEPDGDSGKKMAWNLLVGSYPRRIGYSWIEFGRRERDGRPRYLTLGVGLSAVDGRAQVDSWFFIVEGDGTTLDPRIGEDLWLTTAERQVLTRERLRDALGGRGQLFENHQLYRRAVDERLFQLGTRRYDALMDTLIQLRQPQLSKKPDETGLSNALSESLPPLPPELLGDVAEALNQLEEDRIQLEETRLLEQTVTQFEQRYRIYTGMLARRQARELRQAQTHFDNASEARNQAQAERTSAQRAQGEAFAEHEAAKLKYSAARELVDTLQSDPANQDANRLAQEERNAAERQQAAHTASRQRDEAHSKLTSEVALSQRRIAAATQARDELDKARTRTLDAGEALAMTADLALNPLLSLEAEALATHPPEYRAAEEALRELVRNRRQDIAHLRQRHAEVSQCQAVLADKQEHLRAMRSEMDVALAQREQADERSEQAGSALLEAWSEHCTSLVQLRFDAEQPLLRLADWAANPEGDNPAQVALDHAWQTTLQRHAAQQAELDANLASLDKQRADIEDERSRLAAGEDALPAEPPTRASGVRLQRQGAPLWQLVDFHPSLDAAQRAGLEAAMEASGLLDAWLSPNGLLSDSDGTPLLDSSWHQRAPVNGANLNAALIPALPEVCPIAPATLTALLAGVAYGTQEPSDAEAWLSPDGRYRLGPLAGAWQKTEAGYIGRSARELARQRRLDALAAFLVELDMAQAKLARQYEALSAERSQAERERQRVPSERPLRDAIAAALQAARDVDRTRQLLLQAETRSLEAKDAWQSAREQLRHDATDLRLSDDPELLPATEEALEHFANAQAQLVQAAREWQRAWPDQRQQQRREDEARRLLEQAEETLMVADEQAEQARVRLEALRQSIGQQVEELLAKLATALAGRTQAEQEAETRRTALGEAEKRLAVIAAHVERTEQTLSERSDERATAVERLRHFSASGLLAAALPELQLPEHWSIDPALNLARRIEQALVDLADDEATWTRVQKQIAEDLSELQRGLSALNHQAISEPNDWGITVTIQFQNRAERPDTLALLLAEDIAQRSELLSAREREVLENHLQAEIAAELQRLMRAADDRVKAINDELHKRPTTTGVRYRLLWEPLSVEEGAPAGLEAARKSLLNTSADLWSTEDRRAVGTMLQQQIAAERALADADSAGRSLLDQLAHALDYRYWHRFRIQRQQDGQWRKLSGPASSGERALGLTVPLFAAIASFYGHGGSPLAPRLMLLDEAFAGIDDTARAHCMGLVREFDLDFVITSEREWACYAELPGVSICQLQRREGIDAVFVSRWTWDGRAKRLEEDPDRRFPLA
ncbi:TPA: TIGR02680 family protein [Pseudomonas aeruginosa]|nr:TIGR02680 family protein [Pseudomonas aeruginosa]HCH9960846.1 TIGR02680 family protein [Pseudomonas aeruginosa]HCI3570964.1 TIGR02680 family protein [Pseudomonas aeruginosa]HCJ0549434.1 TIGR02680 family protein [Pseudomonas aeruginosa]HCJ0836092.1 TIGR02680 family protein [Pseudomonas aeruginosa]